MTNGLLRDIDLSPCAELETLDLSYNIGLRNLDLSHNPKLEYLNLEENSSLRTLDISNNQVLHNLDVYKCSKLSSLDVSNSNIDTLSCGTCGELSLNVQNCNKLKWLSAAFTQFNSLDLSTCPNLLRLELAECGLTSLDLSHNPLINQLELIRCETLGETFNVSNLPNLWELNISYCHFTSLDVSRNYGLKWLTIDGNDLKSINLSNNLLLTQLYGNYNDLSNLDLRNLTALKHLKCEGNDLTTLDLSHNTDLLSAEFNTQRPYVLGIRLDGNLYVELNEDVDVSRITDMKCMNMAGELVDVSNPYIEYGHWLRLGAADSIQYLSYKYNTQWRDSLMTVTKLTISHIENVIPIDAAHFPDAIFRNFLLTQKYGKDGLLTQTEIADIKDMDVSNRGIDDLTGIQYFAALEILDCSRNNLTQLNVSTLTQLESFNCWENSLTSIDVSALTKLTMLGLEDNNLTSLDVSALTRLRDLAVSNNQLTSIDVTHNTALRGLLCDGNQLQTLDLTANTQLGTLNCQDNALTAISLPANSRLRYFYCYQNQLTGEALDDIIAALPTLTSASNLRIYYDNASNEGNEVTSKQVKQLAQKGWTAKHYDGSAWVNYAGLPLSYDLWLRGHQVTSTNCNNLTALAGVSGTVASFNELTNTLTLGDVTIISSGITPKPGIESNIDGLTIKLVGTNNINMTDTTAIVIRKNATIKGPGTLTAQSSSSNGIYIYGGTLSVTGGATLNAVANSAPATTKTGFGIYGRTVARLDPRGGTTITYYGSLAVGSDSTKVQSIGSMASVAALNTLTYPTGSTLKVVNPSTSSEVNGYFNNHNVCTRSSSGLSGYTYTPTTALVRIITPDTQTGDVNGDGFVNELDVAALADMLVGNTPFSDTADVDGNGTVSLADLTTLVNMVK